MLVAVKSFFKACKLILFSGLPTAFENAEALFWPFFFILTSLRTLCLTEGPRSFPTCNGHSIVCWGPRSAFLLVITLSLIARQTGSSGGQSLPALPLPPDPTFLEILCARRCDPCVAHRQLHQNVWLSSCNLFLKMLL